MSLNEWFMSLCKGRQEAIISDKWTLAGAAWDAAKEEAFREAELMGEVNLFARNRESK